MAEIVGLNGLHNLEGFVCDLCGNSCDPQAQELNALDCTFSNCPSDASVYHQDCLEKYLKSIKLEKCAPSFCNCYYVGSRVCSVLVKTLLISTCLTKSFTFSGVGRRALSAPGAVAKAQNMIHHVQGR